MGDGTVEVVISGQPRESAESTVMIDELAELLAVDRYHQVRFSHQPGLAPHQSPFILDTSSVCSQESVTP